MAPPGTVAKAVIPSQTSVVSTPGKNQYINQGHSLYCKNLPDKLPKEALKRNLYMLFATYGVILEIVALKGPKMRGQAHIVFRDIDSASHALRALDGFNFFEKEMVCAKPACWNCGQID